MKNWYWGANGYHKTASIWLHEEPVLVRMVEVIFDWLCDRLYDKGWLKDRIKMTHQGEVFHTDFGDWFHCEIHVPVFDWCHRHYKVIHVPVDYDVLKKAMYDEDPEYWDEDEASAERIRREDEDDDRD